MCVVGDYVLTHGDMTVNTSSCELSTFSSSLAVRHQLVYQTPMPNVNPKIQRHAFTMRVDDDFMDEIDRLRLLMRPVPTKSDAVRSAVKAELARREKARAKKAEEGETCK